MFWGLEIDGRLSYVQYFAEDYEPTVFDFAIGFLTSSMDFDIYPVTILRGERVVLA